MHKIKVSEKIRGDLYVGESKNLLKGGRVYELSDEEYNNQYIQTMLLKGFASDYKDNQEPVKEYTETPEEVQENYEEEVILEEPPVLKDDSPKTKMITWDAENQRMLSKEESKLKSMRDRNSTEMTLQVNGEEKEVEPISFEEETEKVRKIIKKKAGRPKKIEKPEVEFVYNNTPKEEVEFVDTPEYKEKVNKALKMSKKKLSKKEQLEKMKKFLVLDEEGISELNERENG